MRAVTAEEMAEMDRTAIEVVGIPGVVLMENAGRGATEVMRRHFPELGDKGVAVLAGGGNNGGDGFVIARHLWQERVEVNVYCFKKLESYRGDARVNLDIIQKLGLPIEEVTESVGIGALRTKVERAGLVVDAMLGTALPEPAALLIGLVVVVIGFAIEQSGLARRTEALPQTGKRE